jgi:hypothetical protein
LLIAGTKRSTFLTLASGSQRGEYGGHPEEAGGLKTLEQFRRSYGENCLLRAAPGQYFRHDEFHRVRLLPAATVVGGWDAYYVLTRAYRQLDYFATLSLSPDSFLDIEVRRPQRPGKSSGFHDRIKPLLKL